MGVVLCWDTTDQPFKNDTHLIKKVPLHFYISIIIQYNECSNHTQRQGVY